MRPLVVAVAVLLTATPALARTTRTDSVTAHVRSAGHDSRGLIYKGTVRSRVFGRGTVVEHIGALGLRGTFTITYRRGKVRGTSVAHARPRARCPASLPSTARTARRGI